MSLTRSAVLRMVDGNRNWSHRNYEATVQVLDVKRIIVGEDHRYRIVLSDGDSYIQGLLLPLFSSLVTSERIKTNTILELEEIIVHTIKGQTVVVILEMDVIKQMHVRIGTPISVLKRKEMLMINKFGRLKINK